jgi:hypothetical protein
LRRRPFSASNGLETYGVERSFAPGLERNFRQQKRELRIAFVSAGGRMKRDGYYLPHIVDLGDVDFLLVGRAGKLIYFKVQQRLPEISLSE